MSQIADEYCSIFICAHLRHLRTIPNSLSVPSVPSVVNPNPDPLPAKLKLPQPFRDERLQVLGADA